MATSQTDLNAVINFSVRNKCWRSLQTTCTEHIRRRGNNPILKFWKGVSMLGEGSLADALRELEPIRERRELILAVAHAMLVCHNEMQQVDSIAVSELEGIIATETSKAMPAQRFHAAHFLWSQGQNDEARDLINQVLDANHEFPSAQTLKGWIDVTDNLEMVRQKAVHSFKTALQIDSSDIDAIMGKACYAETVASDTSGMHGDLHAALQSVDQVVFGSPWFVNALTERMRLQFALGEWEQALETCQKTLGIDAQNIAALTMMSVYSLSVKWNPTDAASNISKLASALVQTEPRSAKLQLAVARPLCALAHGQMEILRSIMQILEQSRAVAPSDVEVLCEFARCCTMMGRHAPALESFKAATNLAQDYLPAWAGFIKCQILENNIRDASQQLAFLLEIQEHLGQSSELELLSAMIDRKNPAGADQNSAVKHLDAALEAHLKGWQTRPSLRAKSVEGMAAVNPTFLHELAEELLLHAGEEPVEEGEPAPHPVQGATSAMKLCLSVVPASPSAHLLLARCHYLRRDFQAAQMSVTSCLNNDAALADAHILLANVLLESGKAHAANSSLDMALSHNFAIRDSCKYHVVKSRALQLCGNQEEALRVLTSAMALPGVKSSVGNVTVSDADRASLFVGLASLHGEMGALTEANSVVAEAKKLFGQTTQGGRVTMVEAELALKGGHITKALGLLADKEKIHEKSVYYRRAMITRANIHRVHLLDTKKYIKCFENLLITGDRSPADYCLLGDAFMTVQRPLDAIKAFESAQKASVQRQESITLKIGQCYVSSHKFQDAATFYVNAINECSVPSQSSKLRLALAELYLKMQMFSDAVEAAQTCLSTLSLDESADVNTLSTHVRCLKLQADALKSSGNDEKALEALEQARKQQVVVLQRLRGDASETIQQQRRVAADLAHTLAGFAQRRRDFQGATTLLQEAVRYDETHAVSLLSLAKLLRDKGDLEGARSAAVSVVKLEVANEEARMLLADIMFARQDVPGATNHYSQLLEAQPDHYEALSRLLHLLKSADRITEGLKYLRTAERSSARASAAPGLAFCYGLYHRFSNTPSEAIQFFNKARISSEWGDRARQNMIEMYLNIPQETIFDDDSKSTVCIQPDAIKAATILREELLSTPPEKLKVYQAYELMGQKEKQSKEKGLALCSEVLQDPRTREYVPALLGVCIGCMLTNSSTKARSCLKQIAKLTYSAEEGDEFERAWLILAELHVQNNKFDLAQPLLVDVLKWNQSCAKAWELRGVILEKESAYKDACGMYERAWSCGGGSNAAVGFRLAFNYLKAKRHVDCVDICHKVLKSNPNYPKIKKDVLDKARAAIRV